ncbi:hypothetical protein [Streptomyces albiaxialis]
MASLESSKRRAAKYLEEHLAPDTKRVGGHADLETSGVIGASQGQGVPMSPSGTTGDSVFTGGQFQGWEISKGLSDAHTVWERQVKNLLDRLTSERDALRGAKKLIHGNDAGTERKIRSVAPEPSPYSKINNL